MPVIFRVPDERQAWRGGGPILLRWAVAANVGAAMLFGLSGCASPSSSIGGAGVAQEAALPVGTGSVSIKSPWIVNSKGELSDQKDAQGQLAWQEETGAIDGLPLTGTGGADKTLAAELSDSSSLPYYCLGVTGLETSGTLGGRAYHVVLACVHSNVRYPADYTMEFTGEWGGQAVNLTGTVSVATNSPVFLRGTIGTQHVVATVKMTPGLSPGENPSAAPPGTPRYNIESGTITVS